MGSRAGGELGYEVSGEGGRIGKLMGLKWMSLMRVELGSGERGLPSGMLG